MEPDLVIALDIGSSRSGYAYQFRGDFKQNTRVIHVSENWSTSNTTFKTSSCLLLELGSHNRIAIGEKAEMQYSRICDEGNEYNFHFFKNFKMVLYRKAGIPGDQLILALEPEAAAVYCMYLSPEERSYMDGLGNIGDKFMVVDMGGGTIDITAVEVLENGQLKQIMSANGGPWGGQRINDAFSQLVTDVFKTEKGTSPFATCTRADIFKMELEFERQKVGLRGNDEPDEEYLKLHLPEKVWEEVKKVIIKNEQSKYSGYFDKTDNGLLFKPKIISEKLFGESLQVIMEYLQSVINEETASDKIVLVGDLAESGIVQEKFGEVFPNGSIHVPANPFYAVLKGAVVYGQNPDIFRSRISRFTYGIDTCVPFNAEEHPEEKKIMDSTGKCFCEDVFSVHVKRNQTISLNEEQPAIKYQPIEEDQTGMLCGIYQTELLDPVYVTDEGCEQIGSILIEMPDITGGTERNVEITMIYGGTELGVKGIDKTTGKEFNTSIVYH